jgi:hypothetical protein
MDGIGDVGSVVAWVAICSFVRKEPVLVNAVNRPTDNDHEH